MIHLICTAGRFTASTLIAGAQTLVQNRTAAWGIAFCHGSRLEWLHTALAHPADTSDPTTPQTDADYSALADLRTDMAMLVLHSGANPVTRRDIQPYARREPTRAWAFCNLGRIEHPERLDPGSRVAETPDPGERLFLHLLNRLDTGSPGAASRPTDVADATSPGLLPVEAAESALAEMPDETAIGFTLMCPEWLLIGLRQPPTAPPQLWKGRGDQLLVIASQPVSGLTGASNWIPLAGNTVMAITRQPRELL